MQGKEASGRRTRKSGQDLSAYKSTLEESILVLANYSGRKKIKGVGTPTLRPVLIALIKLEEAVSGR